MPTLARGEFVHLCKRELDKFEREWITGRQSDPDAFPERMAIEDWCEYLTTVVIPELIVDCGSGHSCGVHGDKRAA